MSQNHVRVQGPGGPVRITMGYDRPLRQLFGNPMPESEDDPTDYSSLLFRGYADVAELRDAMSSVGLTIPEPVYAAVEEDARVQAGNVVRRFDEQGTLLDR